MRNKVVTITAFAVVIFLSSGYTAATFWPKDKQSRPNVLIISLCSFRYKMLKEYNAGLKESVMPAVDDFISSSSFIFSNMFNGMPWTAIFSTAMAVLPSQEISSMLYTQYANSGRNYIIRVPHRKSWHAKADERVDDNDFEKNHSGETAYIKSAIQNFKDRPFFLLAHYKYMHYPLIDKFNADSEWDYYLNADEKAKVADYVRNPGKWADKLPLLLLLDNSDDVPLAHPGIFKEMVKRDGESGNHSEKAYKFKGLLTDPAFIAAWKKSPGYAEDLAILEKVYKGNARYLDKVLGPMLNLWGDRELQDNTIVILTGDHGEMHMEHDMLTHAYSLYDEVLRIPLVVRFPGRHSPVRITDQAQFKPVTQVLKGILGGAVVEDNFLKSFHKVQDDAVVLRTCMNTKRGLRYKNEYKYILDIAEDRPYLYDLKKDPAEIDNIADANPELVDKFEAMFWRLYPEVKNVDHGDCRSSGLGEEG